MVFLNNQLTREVRWPKTARLSRRKQEEVQPTGKSRTIFDLLSALTGTLNYQKVWRPAWI